MVAQSARVQLAGYHPGELEVQRRAGVQDKAHTIQGLFVTRPVSEQLQSFFGIQRLLYTATRSCVFPQRSCGVNTCTRANSFCQLTHDTIYCKTCQFSFGRTFSTAMITCVLKRES